MFSNWNRCPATLAPRLGPFCPVYVIVAWFLRLPTVGCRILTVWHWYRELHQRNKGLVNWPHSSSSHYLPTGSRCPYQSPLYTPRPIFTKEVRNVFFFRTWTLIWLMSLMSSWDHPCSPSASGFHDIELCQAAQPSSRWDPWTLASSPWSFDLLPTDSP
jgi:hypothetical protein